MTTDTIPTMIASITILPPFCLSLAQVSEKSSGDGFVFRIEVSRDGDELPSFVDAVDVCATVAKLIADGDYADVGLHGIGEVGWFCESELLNHFLNGHSLREWDGLRGRDGLPVEIEKNGAEFDFLGIGAIVFSARVCPRSFCLHCLTPFDSGSSIAQIVGKSTVKDSIEITSDQFWTICCPVCIGIVTKLNSIFGIDFVIPPKDAIDNDFDEPNRHRLSLAQIVWEVKSYLREKLH